MPRDPRSSLTEAQIRDVADDVTLDDELEFELNPIIFGVHESIMEDGKAPSDVRPGAYVAVDRLQIEPVARRTLSQQGLPVTEGNVQAVSTEARRQLRRLVNDEIAFAQTG